jgi:phospholipid transport system substrate-binding protein
MQLKIHVSILCALFWFSQFSIVPDCQADQLSQPIPMEMDAQNHLKKSVEDIIATIQDPLFTKDPQEQEKLFYAKAMKLFDFNTFSMLSLGNKNRAFSKDQKKEFVYYFSKLISQTYFTRLAGQDVQNITIEYLKNTPLKPKKNLFRTDIATRIVQGEKKIPVTYRMIKKKAQDWKIYDIKVTGISMVANYREQYQQQISLTPEAIIKELREKVEK